METEEKEKRFILQTYKRLPIEVDHADGVYVYGKDGRQYLDFFGGIAVNALGYGNARVRTAIMNQVNRYMHMSNLFYMDVQVELAETICRLSGYAKIFFTNSGTEAIEGAIKLVRKWGARENKSMIFALTNSFHGRTLGALSLTDRSKYRQGFEPFLPNTDHIAFNDVSDLMKKIDSRTAAVFVEFVQGEGGVNVISDEFVEQLFAMRNKHHFLIVADEIQSGIYRTGKLFSFEHYSVRPDLITVAKPLGGSLPLGGLLVDAHLTDVLGFGAHGTTFGGNPVSCAAGLATLQELSENEMVFHVSRVGSYFKQKLIEFKARNPMFVSEVRGLGLMLGVECKKDCTDFVNLLLSNGVLVSCTNGNVIRILPPLVIEEAHVDHFMAVLEQTHDEYASRVPCKQNTMSA
jgi:predicted acetylornithine/succinylornithine family transaminase